MITIYRLPKFQTFVYILKFFADTELNLNKDILSHNNAPLENPNVLQLGKPCSILSRTGVFNLWATVVFLVGHGA